LWFLINWSGRTSSSASAVVCTRDKNGVQQVVDHIDQKCAWSSFLGHLTIQDIERLLDLVPIQGRLTLDYDIVSVGLVTLTRSGRRKTSPTLS
jgi:hypothetical protein